MNTLVSNTPRNRRRGMVAMLVPLILLYLLTLQSIPNGSSDYYMIDVGETQLVLNEWGTLHATGYPLYVITGNGLTTILKTIGFDAVVAPAIVSLIWGCVALTLMYTLAVHLTERIVLSTGVTFLFGLTRTVWIHNAIAEVYSFGLMILMLLLIIALWRDEIPYLTTFPARIYWLAFIGAIGVAHHRALALMIPALLYATYPKFYANIRQFPKILVISLLLGVLGFVPYIYLPLRAQTNAKWVYGDPSTWQGFLHEFFGREWNSFMGIPNGIESFATNFHAVNETLLTDVLAIGIILGVFGLLIGIRIKKYQHQTVTIMLSGITTYLFHISLYHLILPALILPISLSLAFGWLFLIDWALSRSYTKSSRRRYALGTGLLIAILMSGILIANNITFIRNLTHDDTGLQTIESLQDAPDGSTVMLAWGPRYFAAAIAQVLQDDLQHITLIDHNSDFRALIEDGAQLITPEYTFYEQSQAWWEYKLATDVYLQAIAPRLIEIATEPTIRTNLNEAGIQLQTTQVICEREQTIIQVEWGTRDTPTENLSVFVHLLRADTGELLFQDDQQHPVYGWRPTSTWQTGEVVRDVYSLPAMQPNWTIRLGLYRVTNEGFENVLVFTPEGCDEDYR